ncbi:MAG: hypothetical protein IT563_07850 [Alphaproteobacteria bacterium]|nr:hypothetical protein [Alphaproteobacteria bacterium]
MTAGETGAVQPVIDWLVDGARTTIPSSLAVAEMCERLVARGIPLWRVALFVRALHPEVIGSQLIWREGASVGNFALQGFSAPQAVFGLAEEAA